MPVKKYQDPVSMFTSPSKPVTTGGASGSIEIIKTSDSTSPKDESLPQKPKRHYPNGNAGWKNLEIKNANMRDRLRGNWNTLSGTVMDWLLDENKEGRKYRLEQMLAETKLKDIGILLGISTEKVLLLDGQPTQILEQREQKKLDELLPALLSEVKRRGANIELKERTATMQLTGGDAMTK